MATEQLTFKPDFGSSGSALGFYDEETDSMNINLAAIFIASIHDFYGSIGIPEEYERPNEFEDYLIREYIVIVSHEHIHKVLTRIESNAVSVAYDSVMLSEIGFLHERLNEA